MSEIKIERERNGIQCCATFTADITACCSTSALELFLIPVVHSYIRLISAQEMWNFSMHIIRSCHHIAAHILYLNFFFKFIYNRSDTGRESEAAICESFHLLFIFLFLHIVLAFHCINNNNIIMVRRQSNCDGADLLFSRKT